MSAIYRREVGAYFHSMIGYVYMAVLLFFNGFYFMAYNLNYGYTHYAYALYSQVVVLLLAVPILTMRSMAEERRSRTDQLLLTSPVTLWGIVWGKYLAMVTVLAVPMVVSALCPMILAMCGTAPLTADYAALLTFFLLACVFAAVGLFLSSLTESQVIAAVGTFAALLILYLWDNVADFLPGVLGELAAGFSFTAPMDNIVNYSLFDLGGVVLYLSMAGLFLFLTVQTLQKRRWA